MSIPLNQLCVKAFNKLRDWVKEHPKFLEVLEEKKTDSNFLVREAIEVNLEYYLTNPFSCTEILKMVEEGIRDGYLVELECSTTMRLTVSLGEDLRKELKEKGVEEKDITRLNGFAVYLYDIYLKSLLS